MDVSRSRSRSPEKVPNLELRGFLGAESQLGFFILLETVLPATARRFTTKDSLTSGDSGIEREEVAMVSKLEGEQEAKIARMVRPVTASPFFSPAALAVDLTLLLAAR